MLTEIIANVSFLVSAIASLFLFFLFADSLFVRFDLKTALKACGFALFAIASFFNLFQHSYSETTIWLLAGAFLLIFMGLVLDPHSKLLLGTPILLPTFIFLRDHLLLFALGLFIAIAVFQLVYSTKHRDLIPFGAGFILIAVGEYFYSLKTMGGAYMSWLRRVLSCIFLQR